MSVNERKDFVSPTNSMEQAAKNRFAAVEYSELYKKAWLENDTGVSNEYCQNTTTWD